MEDKPQKVIIEVSWVSLFKVLALALGIWAVIFLREILLMLFAVFIFVAAVTPVITKMQKYMSRGLAVTLFYALIALILSILTYTFIPLLIHQINDLVRELPVIIEKSRPFLQSETYSGLLDQAVKAVATTLQSFSTNALNNAMSFFGGLATVITGVVLSFYLLLEEKNAKEFFYQVLPQSRFKPVYSTVAKISERMGSWVRGQLSLMLIIGLSNLAVYFIVGLSSPLPLGIWAGLCEAIPYVGPFLGLLPALIVAITTGSVLQAVLVVILGFVVIQQLEAHIVVPRVMGRAVGLSPVLVILAVLIGVKLFGLVGAIIGIPAAAIISVIVGEWSSLRTLWEEAPEVEA